MTHTLAAAALSGSIEVAEVPCLRLDLAAPDVTEASRRRPFSPIDQVCVLAMLHDGPTASVRSQPRFMSARTTSRCTSLVYAMRA